MNTFRTRSYDFYTGKLPRETEVCFAVLADLHGIRYGQGNRVLLQAIKKGRPDGVLLAGDMVMRREAGTMESVREFLTALAGEFPVYYALGNHEYKMSLSETTGEEYARYEAELAECGVHFLRNTTEERRIKGQTFFFHGLELPLEYYHKPNAPKLSVNEMEKHLPRPQKDGIHILLAHNPRYGKTYFSWGADLTLCGHYHGGVLRLGENTGVISPQFRIFPPYCCGAFHQGEQHMLVSAGLGEHTIPFRFHNPRELLFTHLLSSR